MRQPNVRPAALLLLELDEPRVRVVAAQRHTLDEARELARLVERALRLARARKREAA